MHRIWPSSELRGPPLPYRDREEAGRVLADFLTANLPLHDPVVLGLPRGGVVVAAEVARLLHLPLDVIIVRKIGHPRHREFAVGALAEGEVVVLDRKAIEATHVLDRELNEIIAEEKQRLQEYQLKFERNTSPQTTGKRVIIADDGLATGATTEAAVRSAKNHDAAAVIVAAPVASDNAVERLERVADRVLVLFVDPEFDAVGRYYRSFPQTTDEEVMKVLGSTDDDFQ